MRAAAKALLTVLLTAASPAGAAVVMECGEWVGADTLIEPWEETTRTFSRGSVRVAAVDLGEPECCPQHLIVLIPANMYQGRFCALVARNALVPNGWIKVGIREARAFRPGTGGLHVSVPVYSYDFTTGGADPDSRRVLTLRVRQAAGTVELVDSE